MNYGSLFSVLVLCVALLDSHALAQEPPTTLQPPPAVAPTNVEESPTVEEPMSEEESKKIESPSFEEPTPTLFDNVVEKLESRFVNKDFRENELPAIVERYQELFANAITLRQQREVVNDLLSNVPATHLGLLSDSTYKKLIAELMSRPQPSFGFELINLDGKYFAHNVLEGGPAELAGVKRGDRVVLIDNQLVDTHARLDWRSDDSYLDDPPVHYLLCEDGDKIVLNIERSWGEKLEVSVTASAYSTFLAAKASAKIIEAGDKKIAYIHLWMIHIGGVAQLLKEKLESEFADCDALIFDLRGRGGNGMALPGIYDVISGKTSTWDKPVVALVNKYSRSAKEVMAYDMKKKNLALVVGERTAGAVIPATFTSVGSETMLMFPTFRMPKYTDAIEGIGVEPDVLVQDAGPYSMGADPLLAAGLESALELVEEGLIQGASTDGDGSK